jgi:single-strand DNA-binding protein
MDLLNRVSLIGNLTADPEVRETTTGKTVAELRLAVDPPAKAKSSDDDGRSAEHAEPIFVKVVLWERTAQNAGQFLHKGSQVLIEGRLRMDRWQDKETGQTRRALKVAGERMRFLGAPAPKAS